MFREARLRPEFAHLYPCLEAGVWEVAGVLSDRLIAWALQQPDAHRLAWERPLRTEHFDFRGGEVWAPRGTRRRHVDSGDG